jgi:hypothetical protein
MAHYALLSADNIVQEVIVGRDENEGVDWEAHYAEIRGQRCKRTSYNGKIRGKYAGIGDLYDEQRDVFLPPCPGDGWTLDEATATWVQA